MEIKNTTSRPLRVPMPGGKKLHLGPGKTGQISPKAAGSEAVKQLIEAGDLEIPFGSAKRSKGGAGGGTGGVRPAGGGTGGGAGGVRHTGDR